MERVNYRVQDGCWNCKKNDIIYFNDTEPTIVCRIDFFPVKDSGQCDNYEKED